MGLLTKRRLRITTKVETSPSPVSALERIYIHRINRQSELKEEFQAMYSRMKYGDPKAVRQSAQYIVKKILRNWLVTKAIANGEPLVITSSAYGSVPTAAHAICQDVALLLRQHGVKTEMIKIDRSGDFNTTSYGNMNPQERRQRMKSRQISLSEESQKVVKDKLLIVVDDLNATGSHEKTLADLLETTEASHSIFCYLIDFGHALASRDSQTEERLNHIVVNTVNDLLPFFLESDSDDLKLKINARTIKFILETNLDIESIGRLRLFLKQLNKEVLLKLYQAAYSSDGYYKSPRFIDGFNILLFELVSRKIIPMEQLIRVKNYDIGYSVTIDGDDLIDMVTGENLNHIGQRYSRMKFGSPNDIDFFGRVMANKFIERLNDTGSKMRQLFEGIKAREEHAIFISPGSRNVESSQNFIFEVAISRINIWLALNDLPTIIVHKLSRLGSSTANYAMLSVEERMQRLNGNRSILPGSSFFKTPIHIFFGDDARITGTTADRTEKVCLERGALSFNSMYTMIVDPGVTNEKPHMEHYLNTFIIKGTLSKDIIDILNQDNFQPVQRMMRLILGEENRRDLQSFLWRTIKHDSLMKVYSAALNNSYSSDKRYADSVVILRENLCNMGLIDENGLPV